MQGLQRQPRDGALAHALGLLRVRQGRNDEALQLLAQAVERVPGNSRYAFVHAVAMHDTGKPEQARATLEQALKRFPNDRELLSTAADYAREAGDTRAAAEFARRFAAVAPDDPRAGTAEIRD